jgi:hypothetical protein
MFDEPKSPKPILTDYIKYLELLNRWIKTKRARRWKSEFARAFARRAEIP